MEIFSRNELYWGSTAQEKLKQSHIAIFGLGGVGGYCAEALTRAGIGALTIVDFDKVSKSNINRQIVAFNSTVGLEKTMLFEKRFKDINPDIKLNVISDFYTETQSTDIFSGVNFIADAIDTMRSKISLLEFAVKSKIPVISSFGAGNRINPTKLYICDISEIKEKNAPFVSSILYQLKKRDITSGITVVTSSEKPFCQQKIVEKENLITKSGEKIEFSKITPASTPFVAPTAGIFMASYIVQKLIK